MIEEKDVHVTVRDGIAIALRIYRPEGSGPFPALLAASPYRYDNNELPAYPLFLWRETGPIEWYVEQGYAYVHMDVRGSGFSEGEFGFMSRAEQEDLYDVIEWIAAQPWSNGRVGGIGQSYYCMLQWFMGIQNPPHLACLGAYDGLTDPYRYMGYPGGIEGMFIPYWFNASVRASNLFPANKDHPREVTRDLILDWQRHPFYDDFWKERSAFEQLDKIKVPLFSIGVWAKQDLHLAGNIAGYHKAERREEARHHRHADGVLVGRRLRQHRVPPEIPAAVLRPLPQRPEDELARAAQCRVPGAQHRDGAHVRNVAAARNQADRLLPAPGTVRLGGLAQ